MPTLAMMREGAPSECRRGASWQSFVRYGGRAFGVFAGPALLALLVLRYLVPPVGSGLRGIIASLGNRYALFFGVALFLFFSALARYWLRALSSRAGKGTFAARALVSKRGRDALGALAVVLATSCVALAFRAWVARPYRVLGASMLPTLQPDDLLAGQKIADRTADASWPHRGDVVVFRAAAVAMDRRGAEVPDVMVKRVIGLPGDRVAMRGGAPVINDWPVPSCDAGEYLYLAADGRSLHGRLHLEFLDDRAYLTVHALATPFAEAYRVKPGEVFVLGDNRGNSVDSRAYNQGRGAGVPIDAIEAHVRWFLTGTHRTGDVDLGRLLRPIDTLQVHLRLEGLETRSLEEGIARCLTNRPADTRPPSNREATAIRTL